MNSNTKRRYPGFSILFSVGIYRKFGISYDDSTIQFNFLFFTIMFVAKDLNKLLESYHDSLIIRIKELEAYAKSK